jgi:hypothetical protein
MRSSCRGEDQRSVQGEGEAEDVDRCGGCRGESFPQRAHKMLLSILQEQGAGCDGHDNGWVTPSTESLGDGLLM